MEAAVESSYKPPPEFKDDVRDSLIELNLTDSTELWLIQMPKDQFPNLDGQEVSLNLNGNGERGNFEVSAGKSYKVVSYACQEPDATVFLSSGTESKIVGKVSRRVSLVHYPEPSELPKQDAKLRQLYERSYETSLTNSTHQFATPTKSPRTKHLQSASGFRTSTHTSRHRSTLSVEKTPSKSSKRKHDDGATWSKPSRSMGESGQDSRQNHSAATSIGSWDQSQERTQRRGKNNKT